MRRRISRKSSNGGRTGRTRTWGSRRALTRGSSCSTPMARKGPAAPGLRVHEVILGGKRNDELFRLARSLRLRNLSRDVIMATLRSTNGEQCDPPLDDAEVVAIVDKALRQADRPDFAGGVSE